MTGNDALRERVAKLEQRLDTVTHGQARLERSATDAQGRQWTVSDLMGMGLTRRKAMVAFGLIASGVALPNALVEVVEAQPTGDEGQIGKSGDRVEAWISELDALEVTTDQATITDLLNLGQATETISSGEISYTAPRIQVEGEGGSADDLDTITGGSDGDILILHPGGEDITVRDNQGGTGQILLDGSSNFTLNNISDMLALIFTDEFDTWNEFGRGDT